MVDSIKCSRQVQKRYNNNLLVVCYTRDVIMYTEKDRLDAVIWLVRRLIGIAEIIFRQSRSYNTLYFLRQVWHIGHMSVIVQYVLIKTWLLDYWPYLVTHAYMLLNKQNETCRTGGLACSLLS